MGFKNSRFFNALVPSVLQTVYKILQNTVDFKIFGWEHVEKTLEQDKIPIFLLPHTALLPVLLSASSCKPHVLISRSQDGQLIAAILEKLGFVTIRGSSHKGGVIALKSLVQAVRAGHPLGLAFDGPKGPPLVPKPGISLLSKMPNVHLFFLCVHEKKWFFGAPFSLRLGSWDRFWLPLPGAMFFIHFKSMHDVKPDEILATLETWSQDHYGFEFK